LTAGGASFSGTTTTSAATHDDFYSQASKNVANSGEVAKVEFSRFTVMRLGIVACVESITAEHLSLIDKLCRYIWEFPQTVQYYNVVLEVNTNPEISNWTDLYFGCKFIHDSTEKMPRVKSVGSLTSLTSSMGSKSSLRSSSSSNSPRSNTPSPRLAVSPRKLSATSIGNLEVIAKSCNHLIIIGGTDQLAVMLKILGELPLLLIANL
jgi:hypothetical protein